MGLLDRISGYFAGEPHRPAPTPDIPGYPSGVAAPDPVLEAQSLASLVDEDRGWRPLNYGLSREIPYQQMLENLNDAADAYRANPLAFRIVELTSDYVLGRGMRLVALDPEVQSFADRFWHHPLNNFDRRQFDWCRELTLSGELFVTFHTNPFDGMSYCRLVPATLIDRIETNPDDLEDERRYHQLAQTTLIPGIAYVGTATQTIPERWWDAADCRHYSLNRLAGTVRGQGDLVPLLPWLRRYKDWLTDRVRINKYRTAFLWDVQITGADRRAILARQAELATPPNPGSVIVHNESELWKAVRPEIAADDVAKDGHALRLMIAAGAGLPLHFLAEGESATRATASEMSGPTLKRLESRQLSFGNLIVDVVQTAAKRSGLLEGRDLTIDAKFEDLSTKDNVAGALAAKAMADALVIARQQGWVDDATAKELLARTTGEPIVVEQD